MKKRKYWYKTVVLYCSLCGGKQRYRYRVYTPKPIDPAKCIEIHEEWDGCTAYKFMRFIGRVYTACAEDH